MNPHLIYHTLKGLQERIARIFILAIFMFLLSGVLRLVLETGWTHLAGSHHFSTRCDCQLLNELLEFFHFDCFLIRLLTLLLKLNLYISSSFFGTGTIMILPDSLLFLLDLYLTQISIVCFLLITPPLAFHCCLLHY